MRTRHVLMFMLVVVVAAVDLRGQNQQADDPEGFKAHLDRQEKNFMARLDEQKKAPAK